ncbi:MAG: prepilin-type N-terminal cleavage/methylation domain-containing protein [Candidatus Paceibacterota bacterium]
MGFFSKKRDSKKRKRGFTLIELLVVIAILLVVGSIVITGFKNFQIRQTLELSVKEVRQMLEFARSETLASRGDTQYGVYLDTDKAVLFEGASYTEGEVGNDVFELHPQVSLSQISLVPISDEILFSRGTGEPSSAGFIEVSLVHNPSTTRTITITTTGIIHSNE